MLTPVALRARRTADAGEHAVLGEQIDEPLGVQDTLRTVAGAADERFGPGCQSSPHAQPWCGSARVVDQDVQVLIFVAYPGGRRLDAVVVSRIDVDEGRT